MPEFERIYAINTYLTCKIENLWKMTPALTSSAPIATGHCTLLDIDASTK